jgi:alpha-galactosidase
MPNGSGRADALTESAVELNTRWAEQAFGGNTAQVPFSFMYGGHHSSELLPKWEGVFEDEAVDAGRRRLTLTFTDPDTGLQVRAAATVYTDAPGVDWTLTFTNTGDANSPIIEGVQAVDVGFTLPDGRESRLHRLVGSPCRVDDWLPFSDPLVPGQCIEFAPELGRSSNGASPFFTLEWGETGVVMAVGWSGQWCASVERVENRVRLQAGLERLHTALRPGESIRSPRILQMCWDGGSIVDGHNLFRRTMLSHVVPRAGGRTVTPPIVHLSTSFYELNDSTEENVLSHLQAIKGLGFEYFWLDAYFTRGGFPQGMGNYGFPLERAIPSDRFPNGLKPIGDAAHQEGMGFVVWFEPERVAGGTHLAEEHPEWLMTLPAEQVGRHGSKLLNIGLPEARKYMTRYLKAVIREYGIDCLRIDYNIHPLPFWRAADDRDPDRVGMAEIRYNEGLYQMWDEILAAYPHLFIDNCSSGGRRIDLETCSRSIPLWRTDATIGPLNRLDFDQAALQNQVMTAGLSRYVPFSASGQMGPTPYLFRSGYNAGIAFCEDCRPVDYPRDLLRAAIEEGKRIRKYYFGNFYPLNAVTVSPEDWCVLQYHRPAEADGMVVAFRRHESPYASFDCTLYEIDPGADYEVIRSELYLPSAPAKMTGSELAGMRLEIDEQPGSLVVEYRRL